MPAEDKDDQNDENAYAFIGTINLAIGENADLEAKVAYAHEYTSGGIVKPASTNHDEIGVGAKATFNLGDITPHIAFDTAIPSGGEAIPWDVGGGVKWNLSADEKSSFRTDLMMYSPSVGDSKLYVSASLVEGEGDEGALEGMGATLTVGLDDAPAPVSGMRESKAPTRWRASSRTSTLVRQRRRCDDVLQGRFGADDDRPFDHDAPVCDQGHRWHRQGRSHDCPENLVLEEILFRFFGIDVKGCTRWCTLFFEVAPRDRPGHLHVR